MVQWLAREHTQLMCVASSVAKHRHLNPPRRGRNGLVFGDFPRVCFYLSENGQLAAKFPELAKHRLPGPLLRWMHSRNRVLDTDRPRWSQVDYGGNQCPALRLLDLIDAVDAEREQIPTGEFGLGDHA